MQQVRGFAVQEQQLFDVHKVLSLQVEVAAPLPARVRLKPAPAPPVDEDGRRKAAELMGEEFARHDHLLRATLDSQDTQAFIELWSTCIERPMLASLPTQAKRGKAPRSQVIFQEKCPDWAKPIASHHADPAASVSDLPLHSVLLTQARTLHLICALAAKHTPLRGEPWDPELVAQWRAFTHKARHVSSESDFIQQIVPHVTPWPRLVVAAKLAIKRIHARADSLRSQATRDKRARLHKDIMASPGMARAYQILRGKIPGKLFALKVGDDIVIGPPRVEAEARRVWSDIDAGNCPGQWEQAYAFLDEYAPYMFTSREFMLPPITAEDVAMALKGKHSAPGPDGWSVTELAAAHPRALYWLSQLYAAIERGAPWPSSALVARSFFLPKSEEDSFDPLSFRVLTYQHRVPSMGFHSRGPHAALAPGLGFARNGWLHGGGPPGQASWLLSLRIELARISGASNSCALSSDIYKAFDQVCRPAIYVTALRGGCPRVILDAWFEYLKHMSTYIDLGCYAGPCFSKPASIPQGCPLSMAWLAILFRPLIIRVLSTGCTPRILADDILLHAHGRDSWARLKQAAKILHRFIRQVGSKASPAKSKAFASSPQVRRVMRTYTWGEVGAKIPVSTEARDLGSHVAFGSLLASGTMVHRIKRAIRVIDHLASLPLERKDLIRLVRTKVVPMTLYACDAIPMPTRMVRALMTRIKAVASPGVASTGSPTLACLVWASKSPDLHLATLIARCKRARAVWHLSTSDRACFEEVLAEHYALGTPGIITDSSMPEVIDDMVIRTPERRVLDGEARAGGPVGLLLLALSRVGICMDGSLSLYAEGFVTRQLATDSWPSVAAFLREVFTRAKLDEVGQQRASVGMQCEWDMAITHQAALKLDVRQARMFKAVASGSVWTSHHSYKAGYESEEKCIYCGGNDGSLTHLLWACTKFADIRAKYHAQPGAVSHENLPHALAHHGIAPALALAISGPLWLDPSRPEVGELEHLLPPQLPARLRHIRTLGERLRGATPADGLPLPDPIQQLAPPSPNVFTDGSIQWPYPAHWAAGAAAFKLPEETRHMPGSSQVQDYCRPSSWFQDAYHLPLVGPACSSTRAEALAVLAVLCQPFAMHVATDSQVVHDRIARWLDKGLPVCITDPSDEAQVSLPPQWLLKPFLFMLDGDLWQCIAQIVARRQLPSFAITKVKSHLGSADIALGRISAANQRGNEIADAVADEGAELKYSSVGLDPATLKLLNGRRASLIALTFNVQRMQAAILLEASQRQSCLERPKRRPIGTAQCVLGPLPSPERPAFAVRRFQSTLRRRVPRAGNWASAMVDFICGQEWTVRTMRMPWILMLVVFELHTGHVVHPSERLQSTHSPDQASVSTIIAAFRTVFARTVREHVHPMQHASFASASNGEHVLKPICFKGCIAQCGAWPACAASLHAQAMEAALALRDCLPEGWATALRECKLRLKPVQFQCRGGPSWRGACGPEGTHGRSGLLVGPLTWSGVWRAAGPALLCLASQCALAPLGHVRAASPVAWSVASG